MSTVSTLLARISKHGEGIRSKLGGVTDEFSRWANTATADDFYPLFRDVWEVSHRAGRAKTPKPTTYDEGVEYYASVVQRDIEYYVMLRLWRRYRRGYRYVSPFDTADS